MYNINQHTEESFSVLGMPFFKYKLEGFESHQENLIDLCYEYCKNALTPEDEIKLLDLEKHPNLITPEEEIIRKTSVRSSMLGLHTKDIFEGDWKKTPSGTWFADMVYSKLEGLSFVNEIVTLSNSWFMLNTTNSWNLPHVHPDSYISGVLYVKATPSDKIGNLYVIKDTSTAEYVPVEGELLLFHSSLLHMVGPNQTNEERIVISFNTSIKGLKS